MNVIGAVIVAVAVGFIVWAVVRIVCLAIDQRS